MENQLQTSNHNLSTRLQPKEQEIAKYIWHVNQIVPFPLSDEYIEAWSKSINELKPDLSMHTLEKLMKLFKIGAIDWDKKSGIQNIFRGLKEVEKFDRNLDPIRKLVL